MVRFIESFDMAKYEKCFDMARSESPLLILPVSENNWFCQI